MAIVFLYRRKHPPEQQSPPWRSASSPQPASRAVARQGKGASVEPGRHCAGQGTAGCCQALQACEAVDQPAATGSVACTGACTNGKRVRRFAALGGAAGHYCLQIGQAWLRMVHTSAVYCCHQCCHQCCIDMNWHTSNSSMPDVLTDGKQHASCVCAL